MSDVNELITEAGVYVDALVGGESANWIRLVELTDKLADALSAEHAEVERLRSGLADMQVQRDAAQKRHARMLTRAERAEAEQHEADRGGRVWRSRAERAEFVNARLTAHLQAVQEYVDEHEHPDDWNVPCVYTDGLRAILDAAADEPGVDEMTRADREQDERDHAFGWPDLDRADDA